MELSPEINPDIYGQLLSNKTAKMGEEQSLQEIVLGKLDSHMQKRKLGPLPHTDI